MNKQRQQRQIYVYADWVGLSEPTLMGVLSATPSRGKEIFSFEYDLAWLKNPNAQIIDPSLQLFKGVQYAPHDHDNFGIFLDSSPDRWGRILMRRREGQLAREEGRIERKLVESDYLLGVHDQHRMGAIRFRLSKDSPFLDDNDKYASPPFTSLRKLEQASLALENDNAEQQADYPKWLKMLIAPGGSLGGARPKASVIGTNQHLWIAKFPSAHDDTDVGAWEMVVYQLAKQAGINMAEAEVRKFNSRHHTFLSKRFDRSSEGERIHYASAMTLMRRTDGDDYSKGVSYLHLAEFIMQQGAEADKDLEQLWKRIVFSICVSNTDDHLRNHGFLLQQRGWVLSPAFDVNPNPHGDGLKLNISETDNSQDLKLAKEAAEYFRVKAARADQLISAIVISVKNWRSISKYAGISSNDQDRMAAAFRIAETYAIK